MPFMLMRVSDYNIKWQICGGCHFLVDDACSRGNRTQYLAGKNHRVRLVPHSCNEYQFNPNKIYVLLQSLKTAAGRDDFHTYYVNKDGNSHQIRKF